MARVYLETSFFSACVRPRAGEIGRRWHTSSLDWWRREPSRHDVYISAEVVRELSAPDYPRSSAALTMLEGLNVLELLPEVAAFAELLVSERVMPSPSISGDALHVAYAAVHRMEYMISWNVKHLANPNKRTHLAILCMRAGLSAPMVVTPDLLQENNDE